MRIDSLSSTLHACDRGNPQTFSRYARQRLRLQTGRPVCKVSLDTPSAPSPYLDYALFDYYNGRCCLVDVDTGNERLAIFVLCLRSGKRWEFHTTHSEQFVNVRLSDMVVAVTIGG